MIDEFKSTNNLKLKNETLLWDNNLQLDEDGSILLEAIKRYGSISLAAKQVNKDYRLAWTKVDELEKKGGFKLIDRTLGGFGGGSAKLTLKGEIFLQKYLLAKKKLNYLTESASFLRPDLSIMGSHCHALETLVSMIEEKFKGFFVEYISVGSENGLQLVMKGLADISGIHLFDKESGEYNSFLLKNTLFGSKIALIKGYWRMQGLIFNKGNPKNVHSIEDILRKDVVFINRNVGSGTRILTDILIQKLATDRGLDFQKLTNGIRGYKNEVRSHFDVATAIKNGKADVGIGIQSVAGSLELDFIPIQSERFDFVILKEQLDKKNIKTFIDSLSSKDFISKMARKDIGIRTDKETGNTFT